MDKSKQRQKILDFCLKHGSITVRDCLGLDINSPRKCISDMRVSPLYNVRDKWDSRINSAGETVRFKRYFITRRNPDEVGR